ncbi:MAG: TlpA disulfide reductase family protein [Nitrospinota bacterium]
MKYIKKYFCFIIMNRYYIFIITLLMLGIPVFSCPGEAGEDTLKHHLSRMGILELSSTTDAPDFTLMDIHNRKISLSELRGKIVLLHIWATWCKPCMEEMPSIQKLYEKFKDNDFAVLAVSIDREGIGAVKPYVDKYGLTFPILLSGSGKISKSYWTWGIPACYLIDKKGKIIGRALGQRNWAGDDAARLIEELSGKK